MVLMSLRGMGRLVLGEWKKLKIAKIVNSRMKDHYWDDADRNRKQNRKESSSPSSSPLVSL